MADLRIDVVDDAAALSRVAADLVAEVLATGARTVVPATGATPLGLYAELAARRRDGRFDPTDLVVVQLDEYLGVGPEDRRSLFGWMHRTVLEPLGIADDAVLRLPLDGDAAACEAFDRDLEARGGIDLAILGLGDNGHLGFNEPRRRRRPRRAWWTLTPTTIEANARYWGSTADVPTRAVTLGLRPAARRRHDRAADLGRPQARDRAPCARGTCERGCSRIVPA